MCSIYYRESRYARLKTICKWNCDKIVVRRLTVSHGLERLEGSNVYLGVERLGGKTFIRVWNG